MFENLKKYLATLPKEHPSLKYLNEADAYIADYLSQLELAFLAARTDAKNASWFEHKIDELSQNRDVPTVSSVLGELRAYGLLKNSSFGNTLSCSLGKGADFVAFVGRENENTVLIEVATPLGRSDEKRTTISHPTEKHPQGVTISIKEIAPFGFPQRPQTDTMQSEVISKVASIKADEDQFKKNAINILWVDFLNPFFSEHFDLIDEQCLPYLLWNDEFYWGALWHAFYAKRNDRIYDRLNLFHRRNYYDMEYEGRFQTKTKLNVAVFNLHRKMVAYESFRRIEERDFYLKLLSLPRLDYQRSWLSWPKRNLSARVRRKRKEGRRLIGRYSID